MFLTSRRLIVARDGVDRRPRSGVQSFPLDAIRHLRIEMGTAPSGRIAVWTVAAETPPADRTSGTGSSDQSALGGPGRHCRHANRDP
jgi:hypothetical protein